MRVDLDWRVRKELQRRVQSFKRKKEFFTAELTGSGEAEQREEDFVRGWLVFEMSVSRRRKEFFTTERTMSREEEQREEEFESGWVGVWVSGMLGADEMQAGFV